MAEFISVLAGFVAGIFTVTIALYISWRRGE